MSISKKGDRSSIELYMEVLSDFTRNCCVSRSKFLLKYLVILFSPSSLNSINSSLSTSLNLLNKSLLFFQRI